jgi:hypothetical protein
MSKQNGNTNDEAEKLKRRNSEVGKYVFSFQGDSKTYLSRQRKNH